MQKNITSLFLDYLNHYNAVSHAYRPNSTEGASLCAVLQKNTEKMQRRPELQIKPTLLSVRPKV